MNESFVFYRSFLEAASDLSDEQFGKVMRAIAEYGINGVVPENMDPITKMAFHFARPQIDANIRRRMNGKKGGRPTERNQTETKKEPNHNLTETEPEPNVNANVNVNANANENVNANAKAKEKGKGKEESTPAGVNTPKTRLTKAQKAEKNLELLNNIGSSYGFSEQVYAGLANWMRYKAETHGFVYEDTGATALFSQVQKNLEQFGEYAVLDLISVSMSNGWKGIIWQKLRDSVGRYRGGPINWDEI